MVTIKLFSYTILLVFVYFYMTFLKSSGYLVNKSPVKCYTLLWLSNSDYFFYLILKTSNGCNKIRFSYVLTVTFRYCHSKGIQFTYKRVFCFNKQLHTAESYYKSSQLNCCTKRNNKSKPFWKSLHKTTWHS